MVFYGEKDIGLAHAEVSGSSRRPGDGAVPFPYVSSTEGGAMIASLRGKVISVGINRIVLDVSGVVTMWPYPFESGLTDSRRRGLRPYMHGLERELPGTLWFCLPEEKALFELLLTVAASGPRPLLAYSQEYLPTALPCGPRG